MNANAPNENSFLRRKFFLVTGHPLFLQEVILACQVKLVELMNRLSTLMDNLLMSRGLILDNLLIRNTKVRIILHHLLSIMDIKSRVSQDYYTGQSPVGNGVVACPKRLQTVDCLLSIISIVIYKYSIRILYIM